MRRVNYEMNVCDMLMPASLPVEPSLQEHPAPERAVPPVNGATSRRTRQSMVQKAKQDVNGKLNRLS